MARAFLILCSILTLIHGADARPRVGLALSGGSARGFAHIGVLQVFEEEGVPVDLIAGTSMGALVGGLKAAGYSAAEIEAFATQTDWADLFSGATGRRLRSMDRKLIEDRYLVTLPLRADGIGLPLGLISGQKVSNLLGRLTLPVHDVRDFDELPTPFRCIATDIVTGEAVVLGSGFLPEALRASMAIPSIFTPVDLNGRLLVDGMLVRNLPAQDAADMGADIVIGVDAGSPLAERDDLDSFVGILGQATAIFSANLDREQHDLCDVVITLDMDEVEAGDFDSAAEIVEQGRAAARKALPRILALVETVPPRRRQTISPVDSLVLREIVVETPDPDDVPMIHATLGLPLEESIPSADVEQAVMKIHGTGLFGRVTYRVEGRADAARLIVKTVGRTGDVFRFGLRYDTREELTAIFNVFFRNLPGGKGQLDLDAIVGDRNRLEARYLRPSLLGSGLSFALRTGWADDYLDIFVGDAREARYGLDVIYAEAAIGDMFSDRLAYGVGLRSEWTDLRYNISSGDYVEDREDLLSLIGAVWYDAFDRTYYPTAGLSFFTRHELSDDGWGSDVGFTRHYGDLRASVPLGARVSLLWHTAAGTSTGQGLPPHYQFILGGADTPAELLQRDQARLSCLGLHARQRTGPHLVFLQTGLQADVGNGVLLLLRGNLGDTYEEWPADDRVRRYAWGGGLTLASLTELGPLEITIARGSPRDWIWHFNFGMKF